jgi:hypothetical protein
VRNFSTTSPRVTVPAGALHVPGSIAAPPAAGAAALVA